MITYLRVIISILLLLSLHNGAAAAATDTPIKVAIFPLAPLNFMDSAGRPQGLYPAILQKIAEEEEWRLQFIPCAWSECLDKVASGEIDLITTIAFTPERAKILDFSHEAVVDIWGQIFTLPKIGIQEIHDLDKRKVGLMKGDINGQNFIKLCQQFNIHCRFVEYASHAEVFRAVRDQEVAAGVAPQHYGLQHTREFGLSASSIRFSPFSIYFAAKKGRHPEVLARIDYHLKRWKTEPNSFWHRALAYWMGGREFEVKLVPRWLTVTLIAIVLVIAVLLLINRTLNLRVRARTAELYRRERQYRDLVENANSIILRWDHRGKIIFLNQYGLDLFGYDRQEIIGRNFLEALEPPERIQGRNLQEMVNEIIASPESYRIMESEDISKDGKRLFIQWTNKAVVNSEGKFQEMLSIGADITKRKELEKDLFQAQKMEAIGTLAGGIAHDFNNILSVIFGYTELAKLEMDDSEKLSVDLEQVLMAAQRAKKLVQQILTFSRKTNSDYQPLQISLLVKETIKMLRSTIPATIDIKQNILSNRLILADPTQIHQLIMNLCTNAFHAMEESGGTLGLALRDIQVDEGKIYSAELDLAPGEYVQIEVSDTGCGIPPETMSKIFEPYYTTKTKGKGTGLGLAVVHGIVNSHKGQIKVYSVPQEGTTIHVYFPVTAEDRVEGADSDDQQEDITGGQENIMVVDDELPIARTISKILSTYGYNTETYSDPVKALAAFEQDLNYFDLVVTDMTMPAMTGLNLAQKMLTARPGLPIILCTGYSELINKDKALQLGIAAYLQKPVAMRTILKTVRERLDEPKDGV